MADEPQKPDNPEETEGPKDGESLEGTGSTGTDNAAPDGQGQDATDGDTPITAKPAKRSLKERLMNSNIYLVLFLMLLVVAGAIAFLTYSYGKKAQQRPDISSQTITNETLHQLAATDATVGDPKQVLNVQSSAVFAGKVLIRDGLEVAGQLQVGGPLTITDLTVTGSSQFGSIQASRDLSVSGNASIQGQLSVKSTLNVSGDANFSGALSATQLTVSALQLNSDLVLTHHLTAGGATPGRTNGNALGAGGTAGVSGSDTAGTVGINTGSSPSAGCFVTINFRDHFNTTPRVLISPVGDIAGSLEYYTNRTTAGFSICTDLPAPAGASFSFDYFVVD